MDDIEYDSISNSKRFKSENAELGNIQTTTLKQPKVIRKLHSVIRDEEIANNSLNQSLKSKVTHDCIICKSSFMGNLKLKMHYIYHHELPACEICDLLFENVEALQNHNEKTHFNSLCEFCREYVSNEDKKEHYEHSHNAIECPYCSLVLQPKSYLKEHIRTLHYTAESYDCDQEIYENLIKKTQFHCNLCNTDRKKEMFAHFSYYHKISVYYLKRLFQNHKVELILERVNFGIEHLCNNSDIFCDICQSLYTLAIPKIFHEVYCSSKYFCRFCLESFAKIEDLDCHVYEKHNNFQCTHCDSSFRTYENLKIHHDKIHNLKHCFYCENYIGGNIKTHIKENHNTLDLTVENLIEITDKEEKNVECVLCQEDLSLKIKVTNDLFGHFRDNHHMTLKSILSAIGSNPFEILIGIVKIEDATTNSSEFREENKTETSKDPDELIPSDKVPDTSQIRFEKVVDPSVIKILIDITSISKDSDQVETCSFCTFTFKTKLKLLCHLHENQTHRCILYEKYSKCADCVKNKINFEQHLIHYLDATDLKLNRCNFCDEVLNDDKLYIEHEAIHHNDATTKEFFQCSACLEIFASEGTFYKHTTISNQCSSFSNITYLCTLCRMAYANYDSLKEHFEKSHKKMVFLCPYMDCRKLYTNKKGALRHVRALHIENSNNQVFTCNLCDKVCKTEKKFNWHTRTTHRFAYLCKICQEKFKTVRERKLHYRQKHVGELNYKCKFCDKTFVSKSGVHTHMRGHNFSATCSYCGKDFTSANSYKEHLQIHIGPKHQCPHCERSFTQKSNLKRHVRIHTGETPYACNICDKKFSDKSHCAFHQKCHESGENKKFKCDCGKSYKHNRHLLAHMRQAHANKPSDLEQVFLKMENEDKLNMKTEKNEISDDFVDIS